MSSQQSQQPYSCNPHITHQRKTSNLSQSRHQQQFSHNPPAGVTLEPVNSFTYTNPLSYESYSSCSFPLDSYIALPNTSEVEGPPGVNRAEDGDIKKTTSAQQAWLKSWIKSRNVKLEESVSKLPNITNTREQILQTHYLLQDMRLKLDKLKEIRETANEDEWGENIEGLENFKKTLESNLSCTTGQKYIEKIKLKLSKVRRHQKWRKKHIKKLQSVRDERQRRRETLHKTIDEWRTEWIAKELALKREQARKEEAEKRVQEAEAKKSEHKELIKLLEKVKKLRDLRRERLKREGHFFPEEDDEFFNKIASLNDAMKVEEARLDQERNAAAEHKRNEAMDAGMKERERERDPVYEYWHQAEFDLDNLVLIRRQWDVYISETGSSCIPPTFVDPSPPANYIWASCLTHDMSHRDVHNPFLFEIAWEVANKVGGIYTVIKTKAPVTAHEFGDRYTLIGPLAYKTAAAEVEAEKVTNPHMKEILDEMTSQGVKWMYGRWLIEGAPHVLLLDTNSIADRLDSWKGDLWNVAGIPSPPNDQETNDAILFGYLVGWFLGDFVAREKKKAVIAHFHEWLAGVAIPLLRKRRTDLTTIFTTHATLLGRYLCAGSVDFYNNIQHFSVDEEAGKRGIYHRYCIERGAAHCCDVFTTVSQITAFEAEHLLKRKPDGVLPNGLNVVKFSAMHEFQNLHARNKEKIHNFVRGHFYGHYDFDLDNTLYFFTAGRYEYRNKGVDMYIESLSRLNHRLKACNSPMTVVAFIVMPAATQSFAVEALKGQAVTKQLQETVKDITEKIGQRIFDKAARYTGGDISRAVINPSELLTNEEKILLKRRVIALKRNSLPPIVTHNMIDDGSDPILNQLRRLQLFNHPSDRVKVVFHPEFLSSNNPLISIEYEDFVRGCHLGVFPSYYEPWGYTPAECTVMGVPSVTTNLSGFGGFVEEILEKSSDYGIYIVDRRLKSVDESVEQLADCMLQFCQKSRRQRINQRNRTERLSDLLDWKVLGMEYVRARKLALHRAYPDSFAGSESGGFDQQKVKIPKPLSAPASPRIRGGNVSVDDLTSNMQQLGYEDDEYPFPPFPLIVKRPNSERDLLT